jgi:hypothetical protein
MGQKIADLHILEKYLWILKATYVGNEKFAQ